MSKLSEAVNIERNIERRTVLENIQSALLRLKRLRIDLVSTTHCAEKLPCRGRKQIQIHTDSHWIIEFLRL